MIIYLLIKKTFRLNIIPVLITTFFFQPAKAQENFSFHNITVEDGLSQSSVQCIHQDKKGLIWIGTADGLNKYDGTRFTHYKHNPIDSKSLSAPTVNSIYEDIDGNLWLATDGGGLCIFNTRTEKFICYKNIQGDSNSISSNRVTDITYDKGSQYLITTFKGGLNIFDTITKKFTRLSTLPYNSATAGQQNIFRILKTSNGTILLATRDGLGVMDSKTCKINYYKNNPDDEYSLPDNSLQSIFEDSENRIWVGTKFGSVCEFDQKTKKFFRYEEKNKDATSGNYPVNCFYEEEGGKLWIGTSGGGIRIINKHTGSSFTIEKEDGIKNSISSNEILSFLKDQSQMLWVGTKGGGVDLYNKTFGYFNKMNKKTNRELLNKNVYSIFTDSRGIQWLGTGGNGLYSIDPENGLVTNYTNDPLKKESISSNDVWSITEDKDNSIWTGTFGGGINIFNPTNSKFININNDSTLKILNASKIIISLCTDNDGLIWIGTINDGLYVYHKTKRIIIHHSGTSKAKDSLQGNTIYFINESKEGLMMIGTKNSGLNIYNKQSGTFRNYFTDSKNKFSISSNNVQCMYESTPGTFWIGTEGGGLNLFDLKTERFIHFTESDGLPNNVVYGILPGNQNTLWLSTNKGICKFRLKTDPAFFKLENSLTPHPVFKNYGYNDGLPSDEFNQGAYFKDKKGTLYFGSIKGVAGFHPDSIKDNLYIPPLILTSFKVFEKDFPLDTSITYKKMITLAYDQNFFSFEFTALNYLLPEKNEYAFKMEGFDKDWIYTGHRRYTSYTNLDPGEYIFKVKASNNDGFWNDNFASVQITINPPFWKTWWFKLLVTVAVVAAIYVAFRLRVRAIQKEEQQKTAFHKALAEVEMKALRAQMNPHFIFNSLSSINKFIVAKDERVASDYLAKFSRLIRLVLENSMQQSIPLDKEIAALELYILMEQLRFENGFEYYIVVDQTVEAESILIPPLLLQPFVENAIWHGLSHREFPGKISINIKVIDQTLVCSIEDNGVGREKAKEIKAKNKSTYKSLGMKVTHERIDLLKQQKNIVSEIVFVDLKDETGNATGTRAEIKIPLEYNF